MEVVVDVKFHERAKELVGILSVTYMGKKVKLISPHDFLHPLDHVFLHIGSLGNFAGVAMKTNARFKLVEIDNTLVGLVGCHAEIGEAWQRAQDLRDLVEVGGEQAKRSELRGDVPEKEI